MKFKPSDLHKAFALAKLAERNSQVVVHQGFLSSNSKASKQQKANSSNPTSEKKSTYMTNFKGLNAAKRKARRDQGLCYDEKYDANHACKERWIRLSTYEIELWEIFDEDDEEVEDSPEGTETTESSIHALKGQINNRTIRLRG